jgi:hypothetical protein
VRLINLYQVYDTRAKTTIGPIWNAVNEVSVARELSQHANDPKTIIGQTPDDFVLILIGNQDQDTGQIDATNNIEIVFHCSELVRKPEQQ